MDLAVHQFATYISNIRLSDLVFVEMKFQVYLFNMRTIGLNLNRQIDYFYVN